MKVGMIGCGKIAEKHYLGYSGIDDVDLFAYDKDDVKGRKFAKEKDVEFRDLGNLFEEVDAVDICVPTEHHFDLIMESLERDKHVFCEKPVVTDRGEVFEIEENMGDKVVMGGYLYRYHPAFEKVERVLENNIIGEPYSAFLRVGGRGSHRVWKHREKQGGAVNEMLVHILSLVYWFFDGAVLERKLDIDTVLEEREIEGDKVEATAEDFVVLEMRDESGCRIFCESDLITPSYMNYMEIQGTNGSLFSSILNYFPTVVYCKNQRGAYNQGNNFFEYEWVNLFEKELGKFVETVKSGDYEPKKFVSDAVNMCEVIEELKR